MNFAARLGCTAVGLRPPSVAPQTRLKPTTETRQRSTYKKAKAVQTNGATSDLALRLLDVKTGRAIVSWSMCAPSDRQVTGGSVSLRGGFTLSPKGASPRG